MSITGTHIQYFFVCQRKLWLFSHDIHCEQESDEVLSGKLLHDVSFKRESKELNFGPIKIDWIDFDKKIVHEVKKSKKMEKAHIWQLKYYLWYLKECGAGDFSGEINYPKLKKHHRISLTDDDESQIVLILEEIKRIINLDTTPEVIDKTLCKKCSYYELCYI